MSGSIQVDAISIGGQEELLALIPQIRLLPGENQVDFADLREAFFLDLSPNTPYETSLVENIVALEWEIHRHRRLRDYLILSSFRKFAQGTRHSGRVELILDSLVASQDDKAFADDLMSANPEGSTAAFEWLAERKIDVGEIVAAAYEHANKVVEFHERKLAELEIRRRRLREDLDKTKAAKPLMIQDALMPDDD